MMTQELQERSETQVEDQLKHMNGAAAPKRRIVHSRRYLSELERLELSKRLAAKGKNALAAEASVGVSSLYKATRAGARLSARLCGSLRDYLSGQPTVRVSSGKATPNHRRRSRTKGPLTHFTKTQVLEMRRRVAHSGMPACAKAAGVQLYNLTSFLRGSGLREPAAGLLTAWLAEPFTLGPKVHWRHAQEHLDRGFVETKPTKKRKDYPTLGSSLQRKLAGAVEARGQKQVGEEVGVVPSAIGRMLKVGTVRRSTLAKISRWADKSPLEKLNLPVPERARVRPQARTSVFGRTPVLNPNRTGHDESRRLIRIMADITPEVRSLVLEDLNRIFG